MDESDVRQALTAIKEYVRETIIAFQEGAGSQDAPMTAAMTIQAIWRDIDLRAESIGALAGTSWFRVEVDQSKIDEFASSLNRFYEDFLVESVQCVGNKDLNRTAVVYVTVGGGSGRKALTAMKSAPGVLSVRDWRWY